MAFFLQKNKVSLKRCFRRRFPILGFFLNRETRPLSIFSHKAQKAFIRNGQGRCLTFASVPALTLHLAMSKKDSLPADELVERFFDQVARLASPSDDMPTPHPVRALRAVFPGYFRQPQRLPASIFLTQFV